jgi:hypothetical protein
MSSVKTRKLDISTILAVVKAQTGSGATGPTPNPEIGYAVLTETKPSGVFSGYYFSGTTLIKRRLNTVEAEGITITIDASNNFTIAEAGTYAIKGRACYSTALPDVGYRDAWKSRIQISNETLGINNVIVGDSEITNSFSTGTGADTLNARNIWGQVDGILRLPANTVLSMKQYSFPYIYPQFSGANNAGIPQGVAGVPEVYSVLSIHKIK